MTTQPPDESRETEETAPASEPQESPRAFAISAGFVFQCVGGVFLLGVCCVWSFTTYFSAPPTHSNAHWMDDLGAALLTIGAAATLVGGVGLVGAGIGLQGERPSSGIVAALVTGLLSLVFWSIFGLYCFKTESWSGRIASLFFAGLATSLFGLAVRAAILLRRFPPPPDQNVVTDEFLEQLRTRRRSGH
ncbi:MAG: hypothetical protein IH989_05610 [Planctomycetes bacterium]|nr:hypothetical protein [Planctomycetota bacterium]